ncbi:C-X-C motif chemokine 10 [Takifugu flavidus]|uniref:Chemokine interleukin-8-like domain-containing protein n=1 Tax=Takifugu flavidus TaxID=433684 RepID=A0A5C6N536_9TELE|nr:C-X-C motif chemokine 10 [Takifugu flavidus]TWW60840.1 hypothetical protein D4764_05G0009300 [Takifugu flavidus]
MMVKPPTLLVVMTLCCCLVTADAFFGCHCLRTIRKPIPLNVIEKIEMLPISGHCRRPEIILTRKNGSKICIDPNQKWLKDLLNKMQKEGERPSSTTAPVNF